jgi:hypothetical protein
MKLKELVHWDQSGGGGSPAFWIDEETGDDTGSAGEDIRLLDRAKLSPELVKITQEDLWFLDDSTVMVNDYDQTGALYQARITTDAKAVAYYSSVDRRTWDLSVPFREFYKTHTGVEL